jgi:peptidylprolyl isomerase
VKERPLVQKDSSEIQIQSTEDLYPLITNKNVIDFLTEYGASHPETRATITTNHGAITIRLYEDTPLHRANFVYLVKQEYFNGTFFHRIVKNFIIQGGNSDDVSTPRKRNKIGRKYLIPAEIKPSRNHRYGTVSGAKDYRENPDNKSAPFEFFIFLGPQTSTSHLNGNYTVFGEVIKGMNVVEKIANLPAEDDDWPIQNVYIQNITLQ